MYSHSAREANPDASQPLGPSGCIRLNGERLVCGQEPTRDRACLCPAGWLSLFSFPTLIMMALWHPRIQTRLKTAFVQYVMATTAVPDRALGSG